MKIDVKTLLAGIDNESFYRARVEIPSAVNPKGWTHPKIMCPFCDGRRPVFAVHLESGSWYCHRGCGGGNPISFMMRFENVSFKEACRRLGSSGGIDWEKAKEAIRRRERKKKVGLWLEWLRELTAMRMSVSAKACLDGHDCEDWRDNLRRWTDIIEIVNADSEPFRRAEKFWPGLGIADEIEKEKIRLFEFYSRKYFGSADAALMSKVFLDWVRDRESYRCRKGQVVS